MSRWESALLLQHSEQYHERGFLRGGDGSSLAIPDLGSSGATEKSIDIEKHHDRMVAFGWCHGSSRRRSEAISDQKTSLPVVTPGSSVLCTRGSTPTITSSGPQIGAYTSQFLVLVKENKKKKKKQSLQGLRAVYWREPHAFLHLIPATFGPDPHMASWSPRITDSACRVGSHRIRLVTTVPELIMPERE